jgi:hypothetical protein
LTKDDFDKAIAEFLANGGEIQQIPVGKSSPDAGNSAWGRPQAKPKDITDINIDSLD